MQAHRFLLPRLSVAAYLLHRTALPASSSSYHLLRKSVSILSSIVQLLLISLLFTWVGPIGAPSAMALATPCTNGTIAASASCTLLAFERAGPAPLVGASLSKGLQSMSAKRGGGTCSGKCACVAMTTALPKEVEVRFVPQELHTQVTHSMPPEKIEIFKSLESWAEMEILPFLKPVEKSWQPQDFLPEPSSEGFLDEVEELRARSAELPDDYFVCLVGDMITEEALPTYQTMLNTLDGVRDETGASLTPWARWTRAWTAEENRHGDLLNKYLYLTGRVDMKMIEKTIQYLIGSGMDPKTENSPYLGFIYVAFQERATFISHGNTARQAKEFGDLKLAQICGTIAADERRHENAYTKIVEKLFEIDPEGTILGLEDMMRKKIAMPAHLMYDGHDKNIFENFSLVAQRTGVYTAKDYADILEHLVKRWNVEMLPGLSSRGQQAQEYVCSLPGRIRKLEERAQLRGKKGPKTHAFSWIFNREVALL